jgi:hypothetical protein
VAQKRNGITAQKKNEIDKCNVTGKGLGKRSELLGLAQMNQQNGPGRISITM